MLYERKHTIQPYPNEERNAFIRRFINDYNMKKLYKMNWKREEMAKQVWTFRTFEDNSFNNVSVL